MEYFAQRCIPSPAPLCKFIAELFVSAMAASGAGRTHTSSQHCSNDFHLVGKVKGSASQNGPKDVHFVDGEKKSSTQLLLSSDEEKEGGSVKGENDRAPGFDVGACGNFGKPVEVECDGKTRDFIDGFGFCSLKQSPFSAALLRDPAGALVVDDGQPFLLRGLAQWLEVSSRRLDETEFNPVATNYQSAQLSAAELEKKFREEEALGRMEPTKESVAREVAFIVQESYESREAAFCVSADIKSAHRLVKIRREDWGYLACKADSDSSTVWLNKCGTFGISSAPYWWAKLFGLIGRFVGFIMGIRWFMHLSFVDDLHGAFAGKNKYLYLSVWVLLAFEMVGTPFGYHKFRGGVETGFVGHTLRYDLRSVGISKRRGDWLRKWFADLRGKNFTVVTRSFVEFLGRLNFVAQVLVWLKPHLAPLFAWAAATSSGTVLKLPETVVLTLMFVDQQLERETYVIRVDRPVRLALEQFRTDAKCARVG
eukprot:s2776_g2.t1